MTASQLRQRWSTWTPGFVAGGVLTAQFGHVNAALALSLKANTGTQRVGVVLLGVCFLFLLMLLSRRAFGRSFSHGFGVASGLFLSVDIVAFHWLFQLHRLTSGPEADILEPILVVLGSTLTWLGIRNERRGATSAAST